MVKSDKRKKKHYERVEALRMFTDVNDLPDVSAPVAWVGAGVRAMRVDLTHAWGRPCR